MAEVLMNDKQLALVLGGCLWAALLSSCAKPDEGDSPTVDSGIAGVDGQPRTITGVGGSSVRGSGGMVGTGVVVSSGTGGTSSSGSGGTPAPDAGGLLGTGGLPGTGGLRGTGGMRGLRGTGGMRGLRGTGGLPGTGGMRASRGTGGMRGTGGLSGAGGIWGAGGTPGAGGLSGAGGAGAIGTSAGTIVPLYTDPGDPSWAAIVTAMQSHGGMNVVAIVNPSDGPGSAKSSAYASGISSLVGAGIQVIGYVATGYGANSVASVEALIDRWKSFYPAVTGIFFDEQSNNAADVDHYRQLTQYAKAQGFTRTVGNPGTDTDESYIGVFDTMLIYESGGLPSLSQLGGWHSKYPKSNFGIIPYATGMDAQFVHDARQYVDYIYLQNDDLPNPWDSLPPSFADLLTALQ
jgi:hypothetical protein